MATQQLVDRAEQTTADLIASARVHAADAEHSVRRAAEAVQDAAEIYAARAATTAQDTAERVGDAAQLASAAIREETGELREDVQELWDDPTSRSWLLGAAAGIALTGAAVWWLRRRRQRAEDPYETSATEVAGWQDPREAVDAEPQGDTDTSDETASA